ncbi:PREDICTED: mitochondrial arginine transporter BAC2 [Ipomoea nil]|uniref:mitochondrial arginine transporter BAC2 n=1 Tax=Ipomoea nil TaxID=35883 RepID=UPI000901FB6A|nr:PREDICTED: mitochondrial arginine transporter BAC2 [Ipomoea nil]XP_019171297.1 PREDICTED: mitochondrial arginine transporter BAC2 [Ipomoea nil]
MKELVKDQTFATHMVAGTWSVALGTALTYPLDTLKVLLQVSSGANTQPTTVQVLLKAHTLSGYSGFYNGLGWLAVGRTLGVGTRFGIYELLTSFYKDGREDNYVYVAEALMAGIVAGAVESFVTSPFELIKLRSQVNSAYRCRDPALDIKRDAVSPLIGRLLRGYTPNMKALNNSVGLLSVLAKKHPNLGNAMKEYPWMMSGYGKAPSICHVRRPSDVISLEGWGALWRGVRSGITRDSVFGGIFFSIWQVLHETMLDWKAVKMTPIPRFDEDVGPLSPLAVSLAAGFSGSVAAAASHSFDTAKCRDQCNVVPKHVSTEKKFFKLGLPGNTFERWFGIHPADRKILYRGIWFRMARSGVASFVLVGSYFLTIDQLFS